MASEYLYYLSTRDGSRLIYAKTLDEHNQNRATYLGL
jgi:cell division protein YceG involved in septum cleavage